MSKSLADGQSRKGGALAVYVGHFAPARVTPFATLVPHAKMKARRTLVELSFARFDAEFARDVAAVSDGDGVSDEARATPEVKVEASRRSAHLFETP